MADLTFTFRSPVPAPAEAVYAWHSRPLAFSRLAPPWETATVAHQEGAFGTPGFRAHIRTGLFGPFKATWLAEAFDFVPGTRFRDRQLKGPFARWEHTHNFVPNGEGASVLEESIQYRLPLGALGRLFGARMVRKRLEAMFAYRHALTISDLKRHAQFAHVSRKTIVVTGSRGLVGSELVPFLVTGGHRVVRLVTGAERPTFDDGTEWIPWNPNAAPPPNVFERADALVHLAGDNVAAGRWSASKKARIVSSRTAPTKLLAQAVAAQKRPFAFVCASAVGFYGDRGDEELTELSPIGSGFFPDVAREWEAACEPAREAGARVVNARIGVVLSPKGGALGKQLFPFKMGAGAVLGSGKQWVPWITIGDTVGALHHALMSDTLRGPVNVVSPRPATNRDFTKALGRALRRPAFLWLPRIALRVLFGEVADAALLASMRAVPAALSANGFTFDHAELEPALRFLLGRS
jgi:uncharacterized protein